MLFLTSFRKILVWYPHQATAAFAKYIQFLQMLYHRRCSACPTDNAVTETGKRTLRRIIFLEKLTSPNFPKTNPEVHYRVHNKSLRTQSCCQITSVHILRCFLTLILSCHGHDGLRSCFCVLVFGLKFCAYVYPLHVMIIHVALTLRIIQLLATRLVSSTPYVISVTFHIRLNFLFRNIVKNVPSCPAIRCHT